MPMDRGYLPESKNKVEAHEQQLQRIDYALAPELFLDLGRRLGNRTAR